MKRSDLVAAAALIFPVLPSLANQAGSSAQSSLWVRVDDLRVRAGPGPEQRVIGKLSRGTEVILKMAPREGFCYIEGDGQYGYVACQHLSTDRVARPKAGADGVDAAQRWVSGNAVTLREAPRQDAPILDRLGLNAIVKLSREAPGSGYCEVQPANGPSGYVACRYLAPTPVVLAHVRGYRRSGEAPPSGDDIERAFWLEPSWDALQQYAEHLNILPRGPWPRNEVLERMKAHLALGINGRKPEPYAAWSSLKRQAAQDLNLSGEARRLRATGKNVPEEISQREWRTESAATNLQTAIGLWGPLHDAITADGGAARVVRLIRELDFPIVRPSLFRNEAELAPPNATAEQASGRFGIVFRQLVTPRPTPKAGDEDGSTPGLYDIWRHTQVLVRPLQRVQLFRDGRLRVEKSFIRKTRTLWHDIDEPHCSDWIAGFEFGDADPGVWRYLRVDVNEEYRADHQRKSRKRNPAGSLFAFYTDIELPTGPAILNEVPIKLKRDDTGFVRGSYLNYDLDRDGIPDISVWEGEGNGPGHLVGPTKTDDRWYRLVLGNINGAWKVLGHDTFSYGCGC